MSLIGLIGQPVSQQDLETRMTATQQTFPISPTVRIPAIGFGTYLVSNDDVGAAVRTAIGLGYRHIDTATVYQNEEGVGEGIRAALKDTGLSRRDIFVTTKLWPGHAAWNQEPKTERETLAEFDASLARLGLDYLDLYLIHSPHGGSARIGQWKALLQLKQAGKSRAVGVSNFNAAHLEELKNAGLPMPDANQIELHPWSQKPDLISYMHNNRIAPIAYSSLAPLSTWRAGPGEDSAKTEDMKQDDGVFTALAKKYGVTEAQLLLRWGIQNGYAVLPKSLKPERMRQNLDLDRFSIDDGDMALIRTMDRGGGIAWSMGDPSAVD
jgi:2,5-diketo-D-gluconate reductase A